jgi:hypothetical protein
MVKCRQDPCDRTHNWHLSVDGKLCPLFVKIVSGTRSQALTNSLDSPQEEVSQVICSVSLPEICSIASLNSAFEKLLPSEMNISLNTA